MALRSIILSGNRRLDAASNGPPSIRQAPPADDADAVRRIQSALSELGFAMPRSFPNGPDGDPDGRFGAETLAAVTAFQKREFPNDRTQWDGRVGKLTLARLDALLPVDEPAPFFHAHRISVVSECRQPAPAPVATPGRRA